MDKFVNLHVHTHYSVDSMIQPERLVDRIAELGQRAIALTDHGTLAGIVDMYLATKEKGIKFIPGCEFYLHYHNRSDGLPKINHITVLSTTNQGFKNLVKLNNAAHENIFQRKSGGVPLMTLDMLYSYREGLHVLSGCPASALFDGDFDFAAGYVEQLCNAVGKDHLSMEMMFSMDDPMYIERPVKLAEQYALPIAITADSHFLLEEHKKYHPVVVQARKGFDYESSKLFVYSEEDVKRFAQHEYVTEELIEKSFEHIQEIVDKVEPIDIESDPVLPIPDDMWGDIYELALQRLEEDVQRNPGSEKIRRERFEKEISIITGSGFQKYFCLLYDIINFCRESGIAYNVRGSAAGCYVLYLWDISSIDPIRYGLLFERFLNVYRNDFPDVDVDIESRRRDDVLTYAWEKWGMRGVATYTTYSHKILVHDLCRVLGLPGDLEELAAEGLDEKSDAFKKLNEMNPLFGEVYQEILGQIRHRGKHAGAVCSIKSIDVPLEKFDSDRPLIAYSESGSNKTLSKIGGVKLDILGVKKLDQLAHMARLTGVKPPKNPDEYPPEIFDTICAGHLTGFFQFGSAGIRDLTMRLKPRTFEDIGLISALYRPGSLDEFGVDNIVLYKNNPRVLHPVIDELLKDSYSMLVYQENVMDVFATVTGMGLEGADIARRKLAPKSAKVEQDPKWLAERDQLQKEFIEKGIQNGYDANLLTTLWSNIEKFCRYGFNKSHSFSYAMFTLQDAWYRTFYPEAFYTALMQTEIGAQDSKLQQLIFEAIKIGLKVVMPHINTSKADEIVLKDNKIYLPLMIVKGLGPVALKNIVEYRDANGEFKSFAELNKALPPKAVNRTLRVKLYSIGAFDGIEGEPEEFQIDISRKDEFVPFDVLGFVVPKEAILAEIDKYSKEQMIRIGIVTDVVDKKTKKGKPMKRVMLAPGGTFWYMPDDKLFVNEPDAIQKGMFVRATVDNYGRCVALTRYRVTR